MTRELPGIRRDRVGAYEKRQAQLAKMTGPHRLAALFGASPLVVRNEIHAGIARPPHGPQNANHGTRWKKKRKTVRASRRRNRS